MPNEGSYEAALKRSREVESDIAAGKVEKYTMLTGDRPTGRLHLGHYFGTIKERVRLQELGVRTNIIIADYQVITDRDTTEHIRDNVYNMVMDYLACGIDPAKTMIFTHSAVPAENQLMLPFLSLVTEAELQRNPTVKAEMEASGHSLTGLLLTYPVHQACDILFCKGNVVPVGRDQLPHIEVTSKIARRFNERYGKVFPDVRGLLTSTPLIPGLDGRKMSKSYGNAISISMTAEETARLIKKSKTDSERFITFDPEARPGVSALLTTAGICTGRDPREIAEEIGNGGSGQLKKYVTQAVNDYFAPIRERTSCTTATPRQTRSPTRPWTRSARPWAWSTSRTQGPQSHLGHADAIDAQTCQRRREPFSPSARGAGEKGSLPCRKPSGTERECSKKGRPPRETPFSTPCAQATPGWRPLRWRG